MDTTIVGNGFTGLGDEHDAPRPAHHSGPGAGHDRCRITCTVMESWAWLWRARGRASGSSIPDQCHLSSFRGVHFPGEIFSWSPQRNLRVPEFPGVRAL